MSKEKKTLYKEVLEKRKQLLTKLKSEQPGGGEHLNEDEISVAKIIKRYKMKMIDKNKTTVEPYIMSMKFNEYKDKIEKSKLYNILKSFPKGGVLHAHFLATVKSDWLLENVIFRDDCYQYLGEDYIDGENIYTKGQYHIFPSKPESGWEKVIDLREKSLDKKKFDENIMETISMGLKDEQGTSAKRWVKFQNIFTLIFDLIHCREIFEMYFREMVKRFVEDNILYIELNSPLGVVYEKETQKRLTPEEHLLLFKKLNEEAKKKYDGFFGIKVVHEDVKYVASLSNTLKTTIYLQNKYPDFCVGFDLVGEEDKTKTIFYYLKELCEAKEFAQKNKKKLNFILHAGESKWANSNLVDAILLGTSRIGHGFNLYRYWDLINIVKQKGIALEICPVSNFVLGYVGDHRNHPVVYYLNCGVPVTISNDDPGLMMYDGVTHDYYICTMGYLTGTIKLLSSLKTLSLNGIEFSMMKESEKKKAKEIWNKKYEKFLKDVIFNYQNDKI